MDLCGWTPDYEKSQIVYIRPQYNFQNYGGHLHNALYNGQKISVRNDHHHTNIPTARFYYPQQTQNLAFSNFSKTSTQRLQNKGIQMSSLLSPVSNQALRIPRFFNNTNGRSMTQPLYTSSHSMQPRMYNGFQQKTSRAQQSTLKSTQYFSKENGLQQSYDDLLRQNIQLKRLIDQQYRPLKKMYQKLKQQNQNRQYLVSQLEWKVKQLAKQIRTRKN